MKKIIKIVFTGGPCSGKTTFMSRAEEIFGERGYRVIVDHESATDLISGGISPATLGMYQFQKYCIALQLKKEELCIEAAKEIEGDKVLILMDRGILDDKGYVTPEEFSAILKDFDIDENKLNDRYDLVVHLVTSAKGAVEAYTLSNNEARYETVEDAIKVDDTILESWKDHPNRIVVGNETDFELKMRRAIQGVFSFLGDEKPVQVFKKYLVEVNDSILEKVLSEKGASSSEILQYYLKSTNENEKRIRRRIKDGNEVYFYSEARMITAHSRSKSDRILSKRQFSDYMSEIDENLKPINKKRYSFFLNGLFYKLDVFNFDEAKGLLSVQVASEDDTINIPSYFKILKEVTDDVKYKNYFLAKEQSF